MQVGYTVVLNITCWQLWPKNVSGLFFKLTHEIQVFNIIQPMMMGHCCFNWTFCCCLFWYKDTFLLNKSAINLLFIFSLYRNRQYSGHWHLHCGWAGCQGQGWPCCCPLFLCCWSGICFCWWDTAKETVIILLFLITLSTTFFTVSDKKSSRDYLNIF